MMRPLLLAMLSMLATQAAAVAPPCGCEQALTASAGAAQAVVSAQARVVRDYVLFSHRKIADDLVRQEGVYLETLLALLTYCGDNAAKTAWLRRLAADTADTDVFADRIARSYEYGNTCPRDGKP